MRRGAKSSFGEKTLLVIAAVFAIAVTHLFWSFGASESDVSGMIMEANAATAQNDKGEFLCFPELKGSGTIHSIYSYSGGAWLDPEDRSSPRVINVEVKPTKRPVLLALSGYDSIAWQIKPHEGARIAGIWVSGYHEPVVLGVPDGVSVGKTFLKAEWSNEDSECLLSSNLERVNLKLEKKRKDGWPSAEAHIKGKRHFLFDRYYRLDNAHNRQTFQDAVARAFRFQTPGTNISVGNAREKSHVISDKSISSFERGIKTASLEVKRLENPTNMPKLKLRGASEPIHKFDKPEGFLKQAIAKGYLKDGKKEFDYYCEYKAALQRLSGKSGKNACQFHVRHKYEKAYTVLGNFEFPPKTCFPQPTVILLPPDMHKPYVTACSGDNYEILYLRLFEKPCLEGRSKCDSLERIRDRRARNERKKKYKS
ncbi:MAG: hypothetical protein AAF423_05515 [Pseudomonadota bacterium]